MGGPGRGAGEGPAGHTKSVVFDRQSVFIGSFNLDPRSAALNTEVGVMIDRAEIGRQVGELMDEGVSPGSASHVTQNGHEGLAWTALANGGGRVPLRGENGDGAFFR